MLCALAFMTLMCGLTVPAWAQTPWTPTLTPGDRQIVVSWTAAPVSSGLSFSYALQWRTGPAAGWESIYPIASNIFSRTITGLTNGQSYQVQVAAVVGFGADPRNVVSLTVSATPAAKPSTPSAPSLTPGNEQLTVSWSAPAANGADISDYDVQYRAGNSGPWTNAHYDGTGTSTTLDGLTNGQPYDVQVRAKNAVGWSDWSTAAAATPDAKPGKPAAPTATVLGATSLRVNWTAPANTGSALTGYTLQQRANNGTDWSPVSGVSGTSHDVTGLTPGTAHVFRVLATNAAGDGAWSDSSSPVTPSAAPAAPAAPAIPTLRPGDRQLEVSWHAPGSDGGSTITGYNIQYRAGASGAWTRHGATDAGSTTTTISGLTNGQDYQVQVRAVNAQGAGPWSASATATPASATTPPEPVTPPGPVISLPEITRFEATPLRDGKSTLSWAVSANTDVLSLVDDRGTVLIDPGDALPAGNQLAVETRVGTVYTLIAVNSNSGLSSKPRTVTVRAPAPVRPTVRPPTPAPVNAAPTGVIVSWVPPATDGMMAEDVDTSAGPVKLANLSATDPDDSRHTFSLSGAAVFEITGAVLYLKQGVILDYETQPRHGFTLTATDGGGLSVTGTEQTLAVTDANEAPTEVIVTWVPPATDGAIAEDVDTSAGPVKIAELSAVDPDADDSHTFRVSDTTLFEITGTALYLKQGVILDYETQPRHGVTLTATDGGGLSVTGAEQTLAVTDANEAPTEVIIAWVPPVTEGMIAEDVDTSAGPVKIAELSAVDPDADDSHVFSLSGADIFEIAGAVLYLKQGVGLDYETQSSYGFTLTATDSGGLSVTGTEQTLAVTNANEAPTEVIVTWVAPVTDGAIAENLDTRAGPVQVATLSATDPDAGDQHRFTLEGEQAAVFEVDGHALSLRQGVVLDRETHPAYPFTVVARDTAGLRVSTAVVLEVSAETDTRARARLTRVNRAILPALSRALVAGTLDAVERRIDSAGAATAPPAETLAGLLWGQAESLRAGRWAEVLGRSSFALRLDEGPPAGGLNTITLWGGGDYRRLSGGADDRAGAADPVHWDGAVLSARLGLDARLRDDLLAGLALSWAKGEFDYTDRGAAGYRPIEGAHESRLLSVYPYVGWHPRAELGLWGALGYGVGEVRLRDAEAGRQAADSEQATAALGGRVRLFAGNSLVAGGATVLNLKGAWWGSRYEVAAAGLIEGLATDVWRLRLALEGSHAQRLAGGGTVTPSVALGLRHDGGDGVTGGGLEWGGGLVWFDPARGLRVEGYGRALLAHAGDIEEWGVGGLVVLTPGPDGRGLSFRVRPGWGVVDGLAAGQAGAGGVERLWEGAADVGGSGPGSPSRGVRWETELGYGLATGGGLLTPYGGLVVDGGGRRYRLGGVFELGRALTLSLESARREGVFESPDHGLMLRLRYGLGGAGLATPARGLHGPHTLGRGPGWEQDSSAR